MLELCSFKYGYTASLSTLARLAVGFGLKEYSPTVWVVGG